MGRVVLVALLGLSLVAPPLSVNAEERTVFGTITAVDLASRSLSVRDGKGVIWNYRVDRDSGIDLAAFQVGDYVSVTLARATPLNMVTPADILRKGDRVVRFPAR